MSVQILSLKRETELELGHHYVADYNMAGGADLKELLWLLLESSHVAGLTTTKNFFKCFELGGGVAVLILLESHFSVRVVPSLGCALIDFFSCGSKSGLQKAVQHFHERFSHDLLVERFFRRGISLECGGSDEPRVGCFSHLFLDLSGCDAGRSNDEWFLRGLLDESARVARHYVTSRPVWGEDQSFDPQGVTGIRVSEDCLVSVHTWPEFGYVACDVLAWSREGVQMAREVIVEKLQPKLVQERTTNRGITSEVETEADT